MPYTGSYTCPNGHSTEARYPNKETYDRVIEMREAACATCGSTQVTPDVVAPYVNTGKSRTKAAKEAERKGVEFTDVGNQFASVVRDMEAGKRTPDNIVGTATVQEVQELAREDVSFGILGIVPTKNNSLN